MNAFKIKEVILRENQFSEKRYGEAYPSARIPFELGWKRREEERDRAIDETCMFAFVTCALTRHTAKLDIKHQGLFDYGTREFARIRSLRFSYRLVIFSLICAHSLFLLCAVSRERGTVSLSFRQTVRSPAGEREERGRIGKHGNERY